LYVAPVPGEVHAVIHKRLKALGHLPKGAMVR